MIDRDISSVRRSVDSNDCIFITQCVTVLVNHMSAEMAFARKSVAKVP